VDHWGLRLGVEGRGEPGVWGIVRLALRLWTWVGLGDEWLLSELGRGIRRVLPSEDAFVFGRWAR
jgi:hypothetical protein